MKPLNSKGSKAARVVAIGLLVTVFSFMAGFAALAPDNKFHTEKAAVKNDISNVQQSRELVQTQKEILKSYRASKDRTAIATTKTELQKAKADLRKDEAYLKADKKALACAYAEQMKVTSTALYDDHQELCQSKKQLKKDLRKGNSSALVDDAQLVAKNMKDYDKTLATLEKQEKAYDDDMTAINKEFNNAGLAWFDKFKIKNRDNKEDEKNRPLLGKKAEKNNEVEETNQELGITVLK